MRTLTSARSETSFSATHSAEDRWMLKVETVTER
jgi:hypothetical protein